MYSFLIIFSAAAVFTEIINAAPEDRGDGNGWNGGRPPPFFPQDKERPIPRYAPTFSRYTPFLTEDTLPKPVYGHQQPRFSSSSSSEIPSSIYKSQGRPNPRDFSGEGSSSSSEEEEREPRYPPFRRPPPYYPGNFEGMPPHFRGMPPPRPQRREYPEPFRGPRGEVEERKEEETPPPFLPPQYRGQRIPPPEYFSRKEAASAGERPFFGPIPTSYSKPNQPKPSSEISATTPFPLPPAAAAIKPPSSNYSTPEHGSEVQLEKGKSRPDRLFAVKPPEFPPIPSPPPYPSPAPFTPPPSTQRNLAFSEVTTRPSPSIYSPLQGPFPSETTQPSFSAGNSQQQPQGPPIQQQQQQQQPGKPKPKVLPQSFRSFFPPGFGPFEDGKIQRFQKL